MQPVRGPRDIARLLVSVAAHTPAGMEIRYRRVNGDTSAVLFAGGAPFALFVLDLGPDGDVVRGIYSITNPDKLVGAR